MPIARGLRHDGVDASDTEVLRALPYWPRDRYLELTPLHWATTRARLDPADLAHPLPIVAVPPRV